MTKLRDPDIDVLPVYRSANPMGSNNQTLSGSPVWRKIRLVQDGVTTSKAILCHDVPSKSRVSAV